MTAFQIRICSDSLSYPKTSNLTVTAKVDIFNRFSNKNLRLTMLLVKRVLVTTLYLENLII